MCFFHITEESLWVSVAFKTKILTRSKTVTVSYKSFPLLKCYEGLIETFLCVSPRLTPYLKNISGVKIVRSFRYLFSSIFFDFLEFFVSVFLLDRG